MLLSVENLSLCFRTRSGVVRALEDVSLSLAKGETLGVVGESGSGKSVLSFAVMGISDSAATVTGGSIRFEGLDLLTSDGDSLDELRGAEMAMIFQNPRTALNPIRPVGRQIADVLLRHGGVTHAQAKAKAVEMLAKVRIPDPERRALAYPFEMSGGMCQRVMIALALACGPKLLIADEPTTGLDVTTQAAIMDLIEELARESNMATLLITHDLGLAAERCHRIAVMHAGHVVEVAPADELFANPRHPYTARLIATTPRPSTSLAGLEPIPGSLPDLRGELPPCRYAERCERRTPDCDRQPLLRQGDASRTVACRNPIMGDAA
ncbi:Oligopeptide transport system permease protein OppB [Paramagnetospirillum magnetotacticum MS-1]|uniref:Oligopeptide transport system permease protein OppB n=2 Tax=Paramagnetospirillum magnetotacticum TaxID=188 RepID=A0A0C2YBQ3_PARME|nr:Oligopeptide transport system permease protein OppB [Paramagnetospirillum magnetotacticum MS-1]